MRRVLSLFILGMTVALHASASSESIDDFIAAEMARAGAPGLAYAVVDNGEFYAGERGEALAGSGRKVTAETPFRLGSISKSFSAAAVMQLAEAGKVDLDSPISHYLEAFAGRPAGAVTIRQFLSHTSGYSTRQGNAAHKDGAGGEDELARHVERIAQWTPAHAPGARWDYSNANYQILGALIETVSGRDYASYIETEILEAIGMGDSFVADGESYDSIAVGHRPWFGAKRPYKDKTTQRITAPAGGVIASASDVAKYMAVMMNGEDDIISAESKAEMMRPASAASPYYGLGWSLDPGNGTVFHTGVSPGTETLAIMVPAERKGAVVLVNAGSGMGFGETADLLYGVSTRALGLDYAGYQGSWSRKALFGMFALLPFLFVVGMIQVGLHRRGLRAKSGLFGMFSLWFPLLMTLALAWTAICLIPHLFGVSMGTLNLFSPDLAVTLIATAVTGVLWAVFRLGVFYSGKSVST
ncbi:MAG: serine hydrolase domain-containing protein [Amphiplicatus sp.]